MNGIFASELIIKNIIMEVITIESQAYKDIMAKLSKIDTLLTTLLNKTEEEPVDGWVDSYEVCTFLKISEKTLQRLRTGNAITYSKIRGKNFYRISEIQRLMKDNIIRRSEEHLQNLIENYKLHVEQRRIIKADK